MQVHNQKYKLPIHILYIYKKLLQISYQKTTLLLCGTSHVVIIVVPSLPSSTRDPPFFFTLTESLDETYQPAGVKLHVSAGICALCGPSTVLLCSALMVMLGDKEKGSGWG